MVVPAGPDCRRRAQAAIVGTGPLREGFGWRDLKLQSLAHEWVSLGTTKTGIVYRLKGNPPQAHE